MRKHGELAEVLVVVAEAVVQARVALVSGRGAFSYNIQVV